MNDRKDARLYVAAEDWKKRVERKAFYSGMLDTGHQSIKQWRMLNR